MIKKKENEQSYIDYKVIRERSASMDHTIQAADFCTSHPNPYRIGCTINDIGRHEMYSRRRGKQ